MLSVTSRVGVLNMRKILMIAGLVVATLTMAGGAAAQRARSAPALAAGFHHSGAFPSHLLDAPQTNVRGAWALQYLYIGGREDFEAWERGDRGRAPIDLSFADTSSPQQEDEGGMTSQYSVRETVQPTAYRVTASQVSFTGRSSQLGAIRFEGRFIAPGRTEFEEGDAVMVGTLTVGRRTLRNVRLSVAAH